jgi:hypothetical protein
LGPEIGVSGRFGMATFRDWDDDQKVSRNQENTSFSIFCGQNRAMRNAANICAVLIDHIKLIIAPFNGASTNH